MAQGARYLFCLTVHSLKIGASPGYPLPLMQRQKCRLKAQNFFFNQLEHLDVLVRFSDSRFAAALRVLAREYVPLAANKKITRGGVSINEADLNADFYSSPELETANLRYLTCYEADNTAAIEAFKEALRHCHTSTGAQRYTEEQVNCLSDALRGLKMSLAKGNPDETMKELSVAALPWLEDYLAAPRNCARFPRLGTKFPNNSFLEWGSHTSPPSTERFVMHPIRSNALYVRANCTRMFFVFWHRNIRAMHWVSGNARERKCTTWAWSINPSACRPTRLRKSRRNRQVIRSTESEGQAAKAHTEKIASLGKASTKMQATFDRARTANKLVLEKVFNPEHNVRSQ